MLESTTYRNTSDDQCTTTLADDVCEIRKIHTLPWLTLLSIGKCDLRASSCIVSYACRRSVPWQIRRVSLGPHFEARSMGHAGRECRMSF